MIALTSNLSRRDALEMREDIGAVRRRHHHRHRHHHHHHHYEFSEEVPLFTFELYNHLFVGEGLGCIERITHPG